MPPTFSFTKKSSILKLNCKLLLPLLHCYFRAKDGKGKGGSEEPTFCLHTSQEKRSYLSRWQKQEVRKWIFKFSRNTKEGLCQWMIKKSRVLKSWARSHLPAELDWRWVRLKNGFGLNFTVSSAFTLDVSHHLKQFCAKTEILDGVGVIMLRNRG